MNYTLTIADDTNSKKWELLNVPLTEDYIVDSRQVVTKSGAIHTYFISKKRKWKHSWPYMATEEFDELRGFYLRQLENGKYPRVSIGGLGVENVPVNLEISKKNIISEKGWVSDVEIVMREAV